ncbi:MAG: GNAT family N-acetyltransferase [Proteobacteria bacterium]|nr:GNAT family N-acetyltransferase [Pseudomonadota bacterium]
MTPLTLCTLSAAHFEEWDEFVGRSPDGCVYAQSGYLAALAAVTGATFRIVAARRADALAGGVALYETRSALHGAQAAPRLLLYYHGAILAPYEGTYPSQRTSRDLEVQSALAAHIESLGYDRVILKSRSTVGDVRSYLARGWQAYPSYTYVVPLTDLRAQWQRVENNLRRLIKRCTETDRLAFTEDEDFAAFFRLHSLTLGRRRVPPYLPEAAFREFFGRIHALGLARLQHARLPDGTAIASQLVLLGKNKVSHTACAGMDPEYARLGATAFLRWRGFEALAQRGYEANDLTDAALNPVTHFKSQLGGSLECAHVLQSPPSLRARTARSLENVARLPRALAGRLLRATGLRS